MENKRARCFLGVIYEDDEKFDKQMFNLSIEKKAVWIRHDKDINEETGEVKKPHYHFVIQLKTACTLSALSKRLEVGENMLEYVKNLNASLRYLIHFKDDNKYNYEPEEVQSNDIDLKKRFIDLVSKDTPEIEKVMSIYEFIESCTDYIKPSVLLKYVNKHNCYDVYRRGYSIIKDLINEHNSRYVGETYHLDDKFYEHYNVNDDPR